MTRGKGAGILLFLSVLLIGVGLIFALPPFEGADEEGHFASIRQIADLGTLPLQGDAYLDEVYFRYRLKGPLHYMASEPYEANGGMTYSAFYARPDLVKDFVAAFRKAPLAPFVPGPMLNWQVQHPPLYYLLMAGVSKGSAGWPLVSQLIVLRLVSYALALGGVLIALFGTLRFQREAWAKTPIIVPVTASLPPGIDASDPALMPNVTAWFGPAAQKRTLAAFLLYPWLVPQFFPEFARMGNDSLCLFLIGIFWSLFLRWVLDERNIWLNLALGVTLGLGLLTKAFFVPMTVGFLAFLLFRIRRGRADKKLTGMRWDNLTLMAFPIILGSFWYFYRLKAMGSFIGHAEYAQLDNQGGLIANLRDKATAWNLFWGYISIPITFVWTGTGSLGQLYHPLLIPFLILPFWLFARFLRRLGNVTAGAFAWLPVWMSAPVLGGLAHHVLTLLALHGYGGTPGWYLHVLMPLFAYAFAVGLCGLGRRGRGVLAVLGLYIVLLFGAALWSHLALFAGVATEDAHKIIAFSAFPLDLPHFKMILERLSVTVFPRTALICWALGFFAFFAGIWKGKGLLG